MKTNFKSVLALLLAAVTVLALPLSASATVITGTYNNKNYSCSSSGTVYSVTGTLTYAASATLVVETNPTVYYNNGHGLSQYIPSNPQIYSDSGFGKTFTLSYSYTDYCSQFPSTPSNGLFYASYYTYKIGVHTILNNWAESFV